MRVEADVSEAACLAAKQLAEDKNAELENNSSEPLNLTASRCRHFVTNVNHVPRMPQTYPCLLVLCNAAAD